MKVLTGDAQDWKPALTCISEFLLALKSKWSHFYQLSQMQNVCLGIKYSLNPTHKNPLLTQYSTKERARCSWTWQGSSHKEPNIASVLVCCASSATWNLSGFFHVKKAQPYKQQTQRTHTTLKNPITWTAPFLSICHTEWKILHTLQTRLRKSHRSDIYHL